MFRITKKLCAFEWLKVHNMTTRENNLLLQFMEMVYPKDLLRYLELTGFREETVLEKDRFGVESGELIVSPKVRDFPLRDKNGMPSMKKTIRWQ